MGQLGSSGAGSRSGLEPVEVQNGHGCRWDLTVLEGGSGMATGEKQLLRESKGRSCLLAFFTRAPSGEELTWDTTNLLHFTKKTPGMHRALTTGTSTCAFLQRQEDRKKRNSYLEMKDLVVQFSFCAERVTKLLGLNWEYTS